MAAISPSIPQSSQIPTGFINLGLPPDTLPISQPEQAYNAEENIADVFGWGLNSADWMQLYDSMGIDSNLVAPADLAQMLQPHAPSHSIAMQHQGNPSYPQNVTAMPTAYMANQAHHSASATPPSAMNYSNYQSPGVVRQDQSRGGSISHDPLGSVGYSIPSELPDNREAYPSRTSIINREIKLVSGRHHVAGENPSSGYDILPGRGTRHVTEDLPQTQGGEQWSNAALSVPVRQRTLTLPQPVLQQPCSVGEHPLYVGIKHHTAVLRLIHLTHEPTFLPPDLSNFPDPGVMSTANLLRPLKAHANTPPYAFSQPHVDQPSDVEQPAGSKQDDARQAGERETGSELEMRWHKWLEEEEKRRLGWGIYIVDSQGASILNVPATFALDEIHAALPSTRELWVAPTAAAWDAAVKRAHREEPISTEARPFNRVLRDALQEGILPRTVSDFGKNIIAHTLYRICIEASALNKLLVGDSMVTTHDIRYSSFPPNLKCNPYTLLERLGVSWHDSVEHPSYFLITNDALRHHAYYKLVHPQFLDQVKYAAGQWESDASKSTARQWLKEWIIANPEASRRVVVHSGQMASLLSRFTRDACWEPVWVLDCCLAMWAVVKFGGDAVLGMSRDSGATSNPKGTIKWSDAPDRIEDWVASGGPTSFQGMQWEFTTRNILTDFMGRLEAMPWNVSKLYRSVLGRLLAEENELKKS
ncbi:hypothetical protein QFC19_008779 [Naganishia cerealis]|uniref:Uncharacterized protein n=1 Tax=Naganishia cerealis TaxID=610337 RepID=A0ACC2UZ36_9TREE|nr:hypothetical protein QFC19_008779 [Naganishia cerealis]